MKPHLDPALISSYNVERFIPALFGRIELDAERITSCAADGFEDCVGPAVVAGHETLAYLVCEGKIAANPYLNAEAFGELESRAESEMREAAAAWRREFAEELADHQQLLADLSASMERVFDRAQLSGRQRDVMRLLLGSSEMRAKTPAEAAAALRVSVDEVRAEFRLAIEAIKAVEVGAEAA